MFIFAESGKGKEKILFFGLVTDLPFDPRPWDSVGEKKGLTNKSIIPLSVTAIHTSAQCIVSSVDAAIPTCFSYILQQLPVAG